MIIIIAGWYAFREVDLLMEIGVLANKRYSQNLFVKEFMIKQSMLLLLSRDLEILI